MPYLDHHIMLAMEQNQWKPYEEIVEHQINLVNDLLRHAVTSCSYYRKTLGSLGCHAPQIRRLEDLGNLPIITKKELQENLSALLSTSGDRREWIRNATGGSTGQPLVFYRDARAQLLVDAAKKRFRRWFGHIDEDKLALIWGADRDFPASVPDNERWLNVFKCSEKEIEAFVRELLSWRPRTIRGYAGSLHLVAQQIKRLRLPQIMPNAVESSAETLTEAMRADIEDAFGAAVFDLYGSREISCIACEDRHHNGLLVADDIRLVEIVREGGLAARGEEGMLIVTDLVNHAMPFIRYEIGDVGTVAARDAEPGQAAFSRIGKISGRTVNTISLPNGMLIHGEFFTHLFYDQPSIEAFQVYQKRDHEITLSVVPGPGYRQPTVDRIVDRIRRHVDNSVRVNYQVVEQIEVPHSGKRLFTISEVPLSFSRPVHDPKAKSRDQITTVPGKKHHVVFLADVRGWAFDINAAGVAGELGDRFRCSTVYVSEQPDLASLEPDLLVVMFWGETYHQRFGFPPHKVVKQVSSHRWANESGYGCMTAEEMAGSFLADAATVIVPSLRLYRILCNVRECHLAPKGFSPEQFAPAGTLDGEIRFGWAGSSNDPCKGLHDILFPAVGSDFSMRTATGGISYEQMDQFYNSVDVVCVASTAEGDPRTVIEALACGCFILATDVGIVPEVVVHGENGLVLRRSVAAFQAAFTWCRENGDFIRKGRTRRASKIAMTRSWKEVARWWETAFNDALAKGAATPSVANSEADAATSSSREDLIKGAYQRCYAREERLQRFPKLHEAFATATGGPHAPSGYQDVVTIALNLLRPEHRVVIDLGAWLGNFSLNAAVMNPESVIFAVEPEPDNFAFLSERAPGNVFPLRLAIADRCGPRTLYLSGNNQGHTLYAGTGGEEAHSGTLPVQTVTLDQLVEMAGGEVDFIKINAEGAEFEIIGCSSFSNIAEGVIEFHLELGGDDWQPVLAKLSRTHECEIIENRGGRFAFVHFKKRKGR